MLVAEPMDRPELYDLRVVTSGVVRELEGVADFRGIRDGDREFPRSSATGCGGIVAICDMFGVGCVEIRFIRLTSVGEIVLAPRPVA